VWLPNFGRRKCRSCALTDASGAPEAALISRRVCHCPSAITATIARKLLRQPHLIGWFEVGAVEGGRVREQIRLHINPFAQSAAASGDADSA